MLSSSFVSLLYCLERKVSGPKQRSLNVIISLSEAQGLPDGKGDSWSGTRNTKEKPRTFGHTESKKTMGTLKVLSKVSGTNLNTDINNSRTTADSYQQYQ